MGKRLVASDKDNFFLEFDLVELFGQPVSEDVVLSFGQAVIDTIIDKTESGKRFDKGNFKHYDEPYISSLEFIAAGKSKNDPNLTLTGSMLASIDILEASQDKLVIGFNDSVETNKAYNHHTGDTVTPRPFFDINDTNLNELVQRFKPEVEDSPFELDLSGVIPQRQVEEAARRVALVDLLDQEDFF